MRKGKTKLFLVDLHAPQSCNQQGPPTPSILFWLTVQLNKVFALAISEPFPSL